MIAKLDTGAVVAGRFQVGRLIACDVVGSFWQAVELKTRQPVVVREFSPRVPWSKGGIASLQAAVNNAARLEHPAAIVPRELIVDDRRLVTISPPFEGRSLGALVRNSPRGFLEVVELQDIACAIIRTMDAAHLERVVHGGLRPDNIFVTPDGQVSIADFGIGGWVTATITRHGRWREKSAVEPFVSHTRLKGQGPNMTDDVFAFGAIIFEVLTGHVPFPPRRMILSSRRRSPRTPPRIMEQRIASGRRGAPVPPVWEHVVRTCLNREPFARPQRFSTVLSMLPSTLTGGIDVEPRTQPRESPAAPLAATAVPEPVAMPVPAPPPTVAEPPVPAEAQASFVKAIAPPATSAPPAPPSPPAAEPPVEVETPPLAAPQRVVAAAAHTKTTSVAPKEPTFRPTPFEIATHDVLTPSHPSAGVACATATPTVTVDHQHRKAGVSTFPVGGTWNPALSGLAAEFWGDDVLAAPPPRRPPRQPPVDFPRRRDPLAHVEPPPERGSMLFLYTLLFMVVIALLASGGLYVAVERERRDGRYDLTTAVRRFAAETSATVGHWSDLLLGTSLSGTKPEAEKNASVDRAEANAPANAPSPIDSAPPAALPAEPEEPPAVVYKEPPAVVPEESSPAPEAAPPAKPPESHASSTTTAATAPKPELREEPLAPDPQVREEPPPPAPPVIVPATLAVRVVPDGAMVEIDGHAPRTAPLTVADLTPGSHAVTISASGYATRATQIELTPGQAAQLDIVLQRQTGRARIESTTDGLAFGILEPASKAVVANGVTPLEVMLPTGDYEVVFSLPDDSTERKSLEVRAGETTMAAIEYSPPPPPLPSSPRLVGAPVSQPPPAVAVTEEEPVASTPESEPPAPVATAEAVAAPKAAAMPPPIHPAAPPPPSTTTAVKPAAAPASEPPAPVEARIYKLTEIDTRPVLLEREEPKAPRNFGRKDGAGRVHLTIVIDREGSVSYARVDATTDSRLAQACLDAVRYWRFSPARKDGQRVAVRASVPFVFR